MSQWIKASRRNVAVRIGSWIVFLGCMLASLMSQAQVLYGVGGTTVNPCGASTNVYTVNQTTGAATDVGDLAFESVAAALNPLDGLLYYFERNIATPRLATWNPTTGVNTVIGSPAIPLNAGSGVLRASFSPDGRLYAMTNSSVLYEVNPATGAVLRTLNTNLPAGGSGDFAFSSSGELFIVANDTVVGNPYQLWQFAAASVANTASGGAITGLTIGPNLGIAATIAPNGLALIPPTGTCTGTCFAMSTGTNNVTYLVDGASGAASPLGGTGTAGACLTDLARGYFADLALTKSGPASFTPNSPISYTVRVWNNGPATPITGVTIADVVPANIVGVTWTCAASGSASCGAQTTGTGNNINHTSASLTLDSGATTTADTNFVTFTINGTTNAASNPLSNTASVTAPIAVGETNTLNNSATVVSLTTTDLAVDKVSAPNPYVPGAVLTYTIRVWNRGPHVSTGAAFSDTLPALLGSPNWSYSCAGSSGATCGALPTTATVGNVISGAVGTLPVNNVATAPTSGAFLTITASITVPSAQVGALANTATVNAATGALDPVTANNTEGDTNPAQPTANLSITKSDAKLTTIAGATNVYSIFVSNAGPSIADGAVLRDPAVAGLTCSSITCAAGAGGAVCPTSGSGAGQLSVANLQGPGGVVIPTLPAASNLTFTLTCSVSATGT